MKEYIVNSEEERLFYKHDELIRCRNCKIWNPETKKCFYGDWKKDPSDYCSWAVKKKG